MQPLGVGAVSSRLSCCIAALSLLDSPGHPPHQSRAQGQDEPPPPAKPCLESTSVVKWKVLVVSNAPNSSFS